MAHTDISIDWTITSSELLHEQWLLEKELGYIFDDFWLLRLSKKPSEKAEGSYFYLSVARTKTAPCLFVTVNLKFSNPHNKDEINLKYSHKFVTSKEKGRCIKKLFISKFFKNVKKIIISGSLEIQLMPNSKSLAPPQTLNKLSADFSQLCCSNKYSDVILKCGCEVFPAHKNILSARCPVFAEILLNTPNDAKLNIKDLDSSILKVILLYIYSGKIESMTSLQSACDILSAADRYCLNELKLLCIDYIKCSFTVKNIFDCFYQFESLQSYALEFIAKNLSLLEHTKEFKDFKLEKPDFATKLMKLS